MQLARRLSVRFNLRHILVATAVVAVLATLLTQAWRRTQQRIAYIEQVGAVNGHARTLQGFSTNNRDRTRLQVFFGDQQIEQLWLYPGSYSESDLAILKRLFPEAKISDAPP